MARLEGMSIGKWTALGVGQLALLLVATVGGAEERTPADYSTWMWRKEAALHEARELPRLTTIADGRVIVIGGGSELRATATVTTELFDPKTMEWKMGPALGYARRDAEVVKLSDGRIFAIGGSIGPTRTGSEFVEVLEPGVASWVSAASMTTARIGHVAVAMADGRILVTGGQDKPDSYLRSAEIYDPREDRWMRTADMSEVRSIHHARLLSNGQVLVFGGGTDTTASHTAELYDPATGTWTYTGSMKEPRWGFASSVLEDGRVIAAGGRVPAKKGATLSEDRMVILAGVEIYDPSSKEWSDGPPLNVARSMGLPNVGLVKLSGGGLAFVGGRSYPAPYHGVTSAEYFDPASNSWRMLPSMAIGRSYQAALTLPTGDVLLVGGRGPDFLPLREVECLEPSGGGQRVEP